MKLPAAERNLAERSREFAFDGNSQSARPARHQRRYKVPAAERTLAERSREFRLRR